MSSLSPSTLEPGRPFAFISTVRVKNLFGYDDIYLDLLSEQAGDKRQVNILYGENGEGKSTILRLIYSALSSENGRGLKNWIHRAPFQELFIGFTDGSTFEVTKDSGRRKNGGLIFRSHGTGGDHQFRILEDESGVITSQPKGTQIDELLKFSKSFSPRIFYITDKREYFTNSSIIQQAIEERPPTFGMSEDGRVVHSIPERGLHRGVNVETMSTIITSVFREEIFASGVFAQQNSDHIYKELIRAIAEPDNSTVTKTTKESLLNEIDETESLLLRASAIGATYSIDTTFYRTIVKDAPPKILQKLALVLNPFLDSTKARAHAARRHTDRMHQFLSELNHFYRDKEFHFDLFDGFSILSRRNGKPMEFDWLSSGEKQLFIILSSIFLTQSSSAIVLIDEPEISLNVMWQREFVDALKRISQYSPVQYILASHSLEILSSEAGVVSSLRK